MYAKAFTCPSQSRVMKQVHDEKEIKSEPLLEDALKLGHSIPFRDKTFEDVKFQVPRNIHRVEIPTPKGRPSISFWMFTEPKGGKKVKCHDRTHGGIVPAFKAAVELLAESLVANPPDDNDISLNRERVSRDKTGLRVLGVWFNGFETGRNSHSLSVSVSFPAKRGTTVRKDFSFGTVRIVTGGFESYVYPAKMKNAIQKAVAYRRYAEKCIQKDGYVKELVAEKDMTEEWLAAQLDRFDLTRIERVSLEDIVRATVFEKGRY